MKKYKKIEPKSMSTKIRQIEKEKSNFTDKKNRQKNRNTSRDPSRVRSNI